MTVSVIVPVYNLENYISASLRSLLDQSFEEDYEIIVADDGSQDASLSIIKETAAQEPKIKIVSQENRGVSAARNSGLDIAVGRYVMFADGDDVLPKNAIETLVSAIRSEKDTALASGRHIRISEQIPPDGVGADALSVSDCKDTAKKLLLGKYGMGVWAKLFVREKIGSLRFPEGYAVNEDKYFLFEYLMSCDGAVVDSERVVYGYLIRENSTASSGFSEKNLDMIKLSEMILREAENTYPALTDEARYNNLVAHLAVLKKIIRSKTVKSNSSVFNEVRKKTIDFAKKVDLGASRVHRAEIAALKIGRGAYSLCVKAFDIINHKKST